MILITGATGNFGYNVAKILLEKNINFKAAAQSEDAVIKKLGSSTNAISFDWNNAATFSDVLQGITIAYVISPPFTNDFEIKVNAFVTEAKKQGVKHIVLITGLSTKMRLLLLLKRRKLLKIQE